LAVRTEAFSPVPNRGMITISIMLANIMQVVDNTILNVALPHIQGGIVRLPSERGETR
jgi:MFS transporter, DHA2 family, multidrug resistance protein